MKLTWSITIAIVFSSVLLLGKQTRAVATPDLRASVFQPGRDLVPSRSEELFRQWRERIEKEIQNNLIQKSSSDASIEPPLRINVDPQTELDRLPHLEPDGLTQPSPKQ
jgi:hypothetical protein